MARAAVAQGIRRMGFSDHFDRIPFDNCYDFLNPEAWWEAFRACQLLFTDTLSIRAGVEVGEPHRFPEDTRDLLAAYPWDFGLGSDAHHPDQVGNGLQYAMNQLKDAGFSHLTAFKDRKPHLVDMQAGLHT